MFLFSGGVSEMGLKVHNLLIEKKNILVVTL